MAKGRNQNGTIAGKLNGTIAAHTPTGWRIVSQSTLVATSSRMRPCIVWGTALAASHISTMRPTSARASGSVFPISRVTERASSSAWLSITWRRPNSQRARSITERDRHSRSARASGLTAASTSAAPDRGTRASVSPVAGFVTSTLLAGGRGHPAAPDVVSEQARIEAVVAIHALNPSAAPAATLHYVHELARIRTVCPDGGGSARPRRVPLGRGHGRRRRPPAGKPGRVGARVRDARRERGAARRRVPAHHRDRPRRHVARPGRGAGGRRRPLRRRRDRLRAHPRGGRRARARLPGPRPAADRVRARRALRRHHPRRPRAPRVGGAADAAAGGDAAGAAARRRARGPGAERPRGRARRRAGRAGAVRAHRPHTRSRRLPRTASTSPSWMRSTATASACPPRSTRARSTPAAGCTCSRGTATSSTSWPWTRPPSCSPSRSPPSRRPTRCPPPSARGSCSAWPRAARAAPPTSFAGRGRSASTCRGRRSGPCTGAGRSSGSSGWAWTRSWTGAGPWSPSAATRTSPRSPATSSAAGR